MGAKKEKRKAPTVEDTPAEVSPPLTPKEQGKWVFLIRNGKMVERIEVEGRTWWEAREQALLHGDDPTLVESPFGSFAGRLSETKPKPKTDVDRIRQDIAKAGQVSALWRELPRGLKIQTLKMMIEELPDASVDAQDHE